MSEEFMEVMQKIVPYVNSLDEDAEFTVSQLAAYCGVPTKKLYQLLAEHLDKNPRPLIGRLRLQIAEDMLINTDMEIEAIAAKCHFASPNFFLASFYHQYRMTPIDYRNTKAR
jgi:transcriptional regulator GlxA family with amidase domain